MYRENDSFLNILPISNAKHLLVLLSDNPEIVHLLKKFCKNNISSLTVKLAHNHIDTVIIPEIVKKIAEERNIPHYNMEMLFSKFNFKTLTISTVNKWLIKLGCKYQPQKKSYYIDNHESPENVEYRKHLTARYFQHELQSHYWYQLPEEERMRLVEKDELDKNSGYKYTIDDKIMYEYHVDDHNTFQEKCKYLPFGGNLSLQMSDNQTPVMIFGQDKCIFCQYLILKGMWTCPDGYKQLISKDDIQGIVLSLSCTCELGYGFNPSSTTLDIVNKIRKGKNYLDEDAAVMVNGTKKKEKLTSTPFVRYLVYVANNNGYWKYKNMIMQLEDCVDILQYIYPQFDFIFLFD